MDAAFAIIFFTASLADMVFADCHTSCLAKSHPDPRLSVQVGRLEHRDNWNNRSIMLGLDAPLQHGPYQHTFSFEVTGTNDIWIGAGAKVSTEALIPGPLFLETSFQPGLHFRGDGPDIGGSLHFRSGIALGYLFENGATLALAYDHRSNADRTIPNPGLDTMSIRYSFTFD